MPYFSFVFLDTVSNPTVQMEFPDVVVLDATIRRNCSKYYAIMPWEALLIQEYTISNWDIGAKQTFWAYLGNDIHGRHAEACLAWFFFQIL